MPRLAPTTRIAVSAGLIAAGLLLVPRSLRAGVENATIARVNRPVIPVLIRNEQSLLIRIDVTTTQEGEQLRSITIGFPKPTQHSDIETFSVFATGDKPDFSTSTPFGKPTPAQETNKISGQFPLKKGTNHFWISCRLKPEASLDRRLFTSCPEIETTSGKIVPTDVDAARAQRIGVALRRHREDNVHTYRIPALATSSKGSLLCVYDMRRRAGRDLQEDIDIGLSRSTDAGQNWEPVRVIMDMGEYGNLPQEQNGCSDPGILVDRTTGEIFVFAVWMYGKPGKHQWREDGSEPGYEIGKSAQILLVTSRDDGLTWSKPVNLTKTLKKEAWWLIAPSPQQGIQLADGTLVMPVQGRDEQGVPFATLMTSTDHGKNWSVKTSAYSKGNECQAALLGSGEILLNIRNDQKKYRAVVVTKDVGETWTLHPTSGKTLIEPTCNASLIAVDSPRDGTNKTILLFSNPHSQMARTHQTIQVSLDDGNSWPKAHHLLLDEGRGAGYSSMTQIDAERIGIVYEGSQSHLTFERIRLRELVTPDRD